MRSSHARADANVAKSHDAKCSYSKNDTASILDREHFKISE